METASGDGLLGLTPVIGLGVLAVVTAIMRTVSGRRPHRH
jgi:hypothetical protein